MQTYLDNVKAKTGKTVEDFRALAQEKGLHSHGALMTWLKTDFDLGHGHATAVAHQVLHGEEATTSTDDKIAEVFVGSKAAWRGTYDALMAKVAAFGPDVEVDPTKSYLSLLRRGKKFGILQPSTPDRFDVGIKLKGVPPAGRLEAAGAWNSMVTHRVRVTGPAEMDDEVLAWLRSAYEAA